MADSPTPEQEEIDKAFKRTRLDMKARMPGFRNTTDLAAFAGQETTVTTSDGRTWKAQPANTDAIDNVQTVGRAAGGRWKWKPSTDVSSDIFGIVGDGVADDTAALQMAANYSAASGYRVIFPRQMTCLVSATIIKPESFNGVNWSAPAGCVTFNYPNLNGTCIKIVGGSGGLCNSVLEGFTFAGNDNAVAVEISGQCGQRIVRCTFQKNVVGVRFHNELAGQFAEWNTAEYCSFEQECAVAIHYKRTNGNESFHGSGLAGINFINTKGKAGLSPIVIDNNCLPYNSPLHAQVWTHNNVSIIENNNGAPSYFTPYFNGSLTVERFDGSAKLAKNWRVFFSGPIQVYADNVTSGSLLKCDKVLYKNGSALPMGVTWSGRQTLSAGSNTITTFASGSTFQVVVRLIGNNYDYRYFLLIDHEGSGNAGFVAQTTPIRQFNSSGWGAPTFSVDGNGLLVITNPNYPANGVVAELTYKQVSDFTSGNSPVSIF